MPGPAVAALYAKHPARIFRRQFADLVQLLHVVGVELQIGRAQIVFQLADLLGPDDDAGNERFVQLPRQRDLRDRGSATRRTLK